MPLVSIIIPLHNKGPYVGETLATVRGQTLTDWEAIVVENRSSDDGPSVVAALASDDPRIRMIEGDGTGPGRARNLGLDAATGEWVLFLDADDLLLPEHLESLLAEANNPERTHRPEVVASDWFEFREDARTWQWGRELPGNSVLLAEMEFREATGSRPYRGSDPVGDSAIAFAPWALHCGLARRDALTGERRWVERLDSLPSEDTAFWFRALANRSVAYSRKATALYRTQTPGFRNAFHDLERWHAAVAAIHDANLGFLAATGGRINPSKIECLMRVWESMALAEARAGNHELAADSIRRAEQWLSECPIRIRKLPTLARKVFGIKWFLRLRGLR
jgi:glycosyltransferase involved in cell wall biosynthesis